MFGAPKKWTTSLITNAAGWMVAFQLMTKYPQFCLLECVGLRTNHVHSMLCLHRDITKGSKTIAPLISTDSRCSDKEIIHRLREWGNIVDVQHPYFVSLGPISVILFSAMNLRSDIALLHSNGQIGPFLTMKRPTRMCPLPAQTSHPADTCTQVYHVHFSSVGDSFGQCSLLRFSTHARGGEIYDVFASDKTTGDASFWRRAQVFVLLAFKLCGSRRARFWPYKETKSDFPLSTTEGSQRFAACSIWFANVANFTLNVHTCGHTNYVDEHLLKRNRPPIMSFVLWVTAWIDSVIKESKQTYLIARAWQQLLIQAEHFRYQIQNYSSKLNKRRSSLCRQLQHVETTFLPGEFLYKSFGCINVLDPEVSVITVQWANDDLNSTQPFRHHLCSEEIISIKLDLLLEKSSTTWEVLPFSLRPGCYNLTKTMQGPFEFTTPQEQNQQIWHVWKSATAPYPLQVSWHTPCCLWWYPVRFPSSWLQFVRVHRSTGALEMFLQFAVLVLKVLIPECQLSNPLWVGGTKLKAS